MRPVIRRAKGTPVPSLGPLEILVIFVIALLVFGPNKLPEIARQVGKGMAEFRRVQHHLRRELDDAVHSVMEDDRAKPATPAVGGGPPPTGADTAEAATLEEEAAPGGAENPSAPRPADPDTP
jgi:TatA/E family protein of Tat protein translocase